ncbi:MAG: exodeoxyribonuclease VII small subunit [Candidatus Dormibacteraceae bacterium]
MSSTERRSVDELLNSLEATVNQLTDPQAPLDRLVADYQKACFMLEEAQAELTVASRRIEELKSVIINPTPRLVAAEP